MLELDPLPSRSRCLEPLLLQPSDNSEAPLHHAVPPSQFDAVSYGVNGIGGPTAVAAAGQALAVSQTGRSGRW